MGGSVPLYDFKLAANLSKECGSVSISALTSINVNFMFSKQVFFGVLCIGSTPGICLGITIALFTIVNPELSAITDLHEFIFLASRIPEKGPEKF
jgi:hypothetical protein